MYTYTHTHAHTLSATIFGHAKLGRRKMSQGFAHLSWLLPVRPLHLDRCTRLLMRAHIVMEGGTGWVRLWRSHDKSSVKLTLRSARPSAAE